MLETVLAACRSALQMPGRQSALLYGRNQHLVNNYNTFYATLQFCITFLVEKKGTFFKWEEVSVMDTGQTQFLQGFPQPIFVH